MTLRFLWHLGSRGHWKVVYSALNGEKVAEAESTVQPFLRQKVESICSSLPWASVNVSDSLKNHRRWEAWILARLREVSKIITQRNTCWKLTKRMVHTRELRSAASAEFLHENPLYPPSNNNTVFLFVSLSLSCVCNLLFLVEGKGSTNYCNTDKIWIASSVTTRKP